MAELLDFFAGIMLIIVICLIINDRLCKIPPEIALLIASLVAGLILKVLLSAGVLQNTGVVMDTIRDFNIDKILTEGILCFMLFSGASDLKFKRLKEYFKPIALLSFLTTIITAVLYGILFFGVAKLADLPLGFSLCFLLGAVVSPTDPIAATGILNKMGLPKDITAIMEGESLFNDGMGVAIFVFAKGIVTRTKEGGFFAVMAKELFGAIAVGLVISFLCSFLIKRSHNQVFRIIVSLFAVSACYALSDDAGFSGAISSVVCGIYFATILEKKEETDNGIAADEPAESNVYLYENFWLVMDKLLNYILYVLIGISFVFVSEFKAMAAAAIAAILINLVSRYVGVLLPTVFYTSIPGGYSRWQYTNLMTWSGLKGGLCLALVMSTADYVDKSVYPILLFIVFVTIFFTTVIQGLTVAGVYKSLKRKF